MKQTIAEVAVPISFALNEQFDYLIPKDLAGRVAVGSRVQVSFRARKVVGYVFCLKDTSRFKDKLKPVEKVLDEKPLLDPFLFKMAQKIQADYFCSLSEAIATVLPLGAKRTKDLGVVLKPQTVGSLAYSQEESEILKSLKLQAPVVLIHDPSNRKRWNFYSALIKKNLDEKKSVIFLVPDHAKIEKALERLHIGLKPVVISSGVSGARSLEVWRQIQEAPVSWVVGTRSAVFAPVNNLGIILMEEEDHFAYRSDQVPFYRTFDLSLFKTREFKAQLVCGAQTPSLETYAFVRFNDYPQDAYLKLSFQETPPVVKLIDTRLRGGFKRRAALISKTLENAIADILQQKQKMLIFVQQKGFSTYLYCKKCKTTITCPHCSSSLVFYHDAHILSCSKCRYTTEPVEICPGCKRSYVKYFGFGEEKVESEILRLFPSARIARYGGSQDILKDYDIMLATQKFLESPDLDTVLFDKVAVLGCEQMLGHLDFRSTEKAFARLLRLSSVANSELLLQTQIMEHEALGALSRYAVEAYYENEYRQRQESGLPPAVRVGVLVVRGAKETQSSETARDIYKKLKKTFSRDNTITCFEPMKAIPFKVRGNYRYQILIKYGQLDLLRKPVMGVIHQRARSTIVTFDPCL